MEKSFKVDILTPSEQLYSGDVVSLVVPAYKGYLGVLANHAPLIARLLPGKITLRKSQGEVSVIDSNKAGLIEVLDNNVSILLEA